MLDVIKQAALDVIEASNPVAIQFGTVSSISPLEISVDQRLILSEAFLIVPESIVSVGLAQGDSVLLLRVQGGQQFVVLDKVVSG